METSLYLVSNAIHIYAIAVFLDSFLGEVKSRTIYKKAAYIAYYFIGSLVWIISQNTNINLVINTAAKIADTAAQIAMTVQLGKNESFLQYGFVRLECL